MPALARPCGGALPVSDSQGGVVRLQDHYKTLAFKTLAFWQLVIEQYDAKYIIKVDDDNYVRLDRLAIAVRQWDDQGAGAPLAGSTACCLKAGPCGDMR